jgi:hypothetical protein
MTYSIFLTYVIEKRLHTIAVPRPSWIMQKSTAYGRHCRGRCSTIKIKPIIKPTLLSPKTKREKKNIIVSVVEKIHIIETGYRIVMNK